MTPELKIACELVFQEHKAALHPIAWNRDIFRGRLSTGLSEMAKETLVQKNIIRFPNPAKKNHTVLNPSAAMAANYEEAEEFVLHGVPEMAGHAEEERPAYTNSVAAYLSRSVNTPRLVAISGKAQVIEHQTKWYVKPVFVYLVWPLLGAIAGGIIAWLIGEAYTELMFDLK